MDVSDAWCTSTKYQGDINQMHESSSLMICLGKPDVRHHIPDCQSAVKAYIHEDNLAQDL